MLVSSILPFLVDFEATEMKAPYKGPTRNDKHKLRKNQELDYA